MNSHRKVNSSELIFSLQKYISASRSQKKKLKTIYVLCSYMQEQRCLLAIYYWNVGCQMRLANADKLVARSLLLEVNRKRSNALFTLSKVHFFLVVRPPFNALKIRLNVFFITTTTTSSTSIVLFDKINIHRMKDVFADSNSIFKFQIE